MPISTSMRDKLVRSARTAIWRLQALCMRFAYQTYHPYGGQNYSGWALCERLALRKIAPKDLVNSARNDLAFFKHGVNSLFRSTKFIRINGKNATGFNPSIHNFNNELYCIQRTANYFVNKYQIMTTKSNEKIKIQFNGHTM